MVDHSPKITLHQMDEDDSLELLQQILKLNILDVDPHGSSTSATGRDTAESPSRNLSNNNGSDNCGALSAAIDACDIAEGWNDEVETKKPKRGRPRKRVVNSREFIYCAPYLHSEFIKLSRQKAASIITM